MSSTYSGNAGNVTGNTPIAITGATTASPVVITTATHGYSDGDTVHIPSIGGIAGVVGYWPIHVLSSTTFALLGSTGTGTYTAATGTVVNLGPATSVTIPSDGDRVNAASVNPAFEGLGDQAAYAMGLANKFPYTPNATGGFDSGFTDVPMGHPLASHVVRDANNLKYLHDRLGLFFLADQRHAGTNTSPAIDLVSGGTTTGTLSLLTGGSAAVSDQLECTFSTTVQLLAATAGDVVECTCDLQANQNGGGFVSIPGARQLVQWTLGSGTSPPTADLRGLSVTGRLPITVAGTIDLRALFTLSLSSTGDHAKLLYPWSSSYRLWRFS